ncbi:hypothetical protein EJB05_20200, partial [Eragrostis curvula]
MGEPHQSVQALATSLRALPPEFVRPEQEQPGATTFRGSAAPEAPVIDMSEPGCGARMADAAREWGLFEVVNHGVPAAAVAELQRVGRAFFSLPQALQKQKFQTGTKAHSRRERQPSVTARLRCLTLSDGEIHRLKQ